MLDFTLPSSTGADFKLNSIQRPIILFFYPRDNTPGCTIENQDFAKYYSEFLANDVDVIGISRDNVKSHCNFSAKFSLPFPLLADVNEEVCNLFGVMKDKNMYGKKVRGIERSTFIINTSREVIKEWRKVKVDGHAAEVLEFIKSI